MKHKKITMARARLIEFDDSGRIIKKIPVKVRLCTSETPQLFEIELPDKRMTRHTSIIFSRRAIETIIYTNHCKQ